MNRTTSFKVGIWLLAILCASDLSADSFTKVSYSKFDVWVDCQNATTVAFYYSLSKDIGNSKRPDAKHFKPDPNVGKECQPTKGEAFTRIMEDKTIRQKERTYDRGHLVNANHLDASDDSILETFFMTNIIPQSTVFNQRGGAWYHTDVIAECYRDISKLEIWGGCIVGMNTKDDYFKSTHNTVTPDFMWKVLYRHDKNQYSAWLFPSTNGTIADNINYYNITLAQLISLIPLNPGIKLAAGANQVDAWSVEVSGKFLLREGKKTEFS